MECTGTQERKRMSAFAAVLFLQSLFLRKESRERLGNDRKVKQKKLCRGKKEILLVPVLRVRYRISTRECEEELSLSKRWEASRTVCRWLSSVRIHPSCFPASPSRTECTYTSILMVALWWRGKLRVGMCFSVFLK